MLRTILNHFSRNASIVFQRWLRKFGFQNLIFLILLRFWAGFCNILNLSFWSFFKLQIFKNDAQALQNDSQNASGSILKPFEKHHFSSYWSKFSLIILDFGRCQTLSKINHLELSCCESKLKYYELTLKNYPSRFECSEYHKLTKSDP